MGAVVFLGPCDASATPGKTVKISRTLPECPVKFIRGALVACDGTVWVAGEQCSVHRLVLSETYNTFWEDMRYFPGIPDTDAFTCIAEDLQNRIWTGTDNKGVCVFNGEKWKVYDRSNALPGDHVYSVAVAPQSGLVAVATSGGVALYDPQQDRWRDLSRAEGLAEDQVESAVFDGRDNLWLGYACGGVGSSSPEKNYREWKNRQARWYWDNTRTLRQPVKHRGSELPSNLCNVLLAARDGSLLAGTCAGLGCLDAKGTWSYLRGNDYFAKNQGVYSPGKKKKLPKKEDADQLLPDDYVTCLAETDRGYWVGTRKGAALLGKKSLQVIKHVRGDAGNPMPCPWLRSLLVLPNGAVLGATYGKGLVALSSRPETASLVVKEPRPAPVSLPSTCPVPGEKELIADLQDYEQKKGKAPQVPVFFVDEDWSTLGDWCHRYGNRRTVLCATNAPVSDGYAVDPSFFRLRKAPPNNEGIEYIQDTLYNVSRTIGPIRKKDDAIRSWIMTVNDPGNRNILYNYQYSVRTKADWDDHGEAYATSRDGPDVWLVLVVPEGISTASLYFYNQKGFSLSSDAQRDYLVEVKKYKPVTDLRLLPMDFQQARKFSKDKWIEGSYDYEKDLDNMVKAPVLARCRVKDFISTPVYKTFVLEGPATYCVRICRNNSFNTIVSGVFLGQDVSFREREDEKHLDSSFYKMAIHPPAVREDEASALEKVFLRAMRMPENGFVKNGAEFSRRRSLLLKGYRLLARQKKESSRALCSHARWALHLWNREDREQFDRHMLDLWKVAQENCVGMRSRTFTPYSPGTIPFDTKEILAMDELGIDWKTYRDDAAEAPKVPVGEMKKILQEHIRNKTNNNNQPRKYSHE